MNLEIEIFKNQIKKFDFESELGLSLIEESIFNESTEKEFFRYVLKNKLNKKIQFTYYPCNRSIISNEITVILIYPKGGTTTLSNFLAYKQLNRRLNQRDISQYRFKVDCDNLKQSMQFQLQNISSLLYDDFKEYIITDKWIFIPIHELKDDY